MTPGDKVLVEATVALLGEVVTVTLKGVQGVVHVRMRPDEIHAAPAKLKKTAA